MHDPVEAEIERCRFLLYCAINSDFAKFQMTLNLRIEDSGSWCKSISTDGNSVFVNRDFVKRLPRPEITYCLAYIGARFAPEMMDVPAGVERDWWDVARDYAINTHIFRQIERFKGAMPMEALYDYRITADTPIATIYQTVRSQARALPHTLGEWLNEQEPEGSGRPSFDRQAAHDLVRGPQNDTSLRLPLPAFEEVVANGGDAIPWLDERAARDMTDIMCRGLAAVMPPRDVLRRPAWKIADIEAWYALIDSMLSLLAEKMSPTNFFVSFRVAIMDFQLYVRIDKMPKIEALIQGNRHLVLA